jgi:hypothetical protein
MMSTLKTNHAIALGLAAAIAVIGTSAAWAARGNPHSSRGIIVEDRGQKTYLPGEGGCKDEMLHWSQPCGD